MKFEIRRYGIVVIPENDEDRAYIEDTMQLKRHGDSLLLRRRNAKGLDTIAYLETIHEIPTHIDDNDLPRSYD